MRKDVNEFPEALACFVALQLPFGESLGGDGTIVRGGGSQRDRRSRCIHEREGEPGRSRRQPGVELRRGQVFARRSRGEPVCA